MNIDQAKYTTATGWQLSKNQIDLERNCHVVLAFGNRHLISDEAVFNSIRKKYSSAHILICSTSGEISGTEVNDDTITLTAIQFDNTVVRAASINIKDIENNSYDAGKHLATALQGDDLVNIFVVSDGHLVNGSELVSGLQHHLSKETILTGGLAGDGADFQKTLVGLNTLPIEGEIAAIGFYSKQLLVNYGSMGGWDPFGPHRLITKSIGSTLYEVDGKPALDIYKRYLGEYADELPGSALLFPLSIRQRGCDRSVVRTILSINEEEKSLTFAGNMPEGAHAQLMKANFDRLIEGASNAAQHSIENHRNNPDLAILISCVGRKLVLGMRIDEEVEAVKDTYGDNTVITGFYSYGEIAPSFQFKECELHNQTMTITTLTELL